MFPLHEYWLEHKRAAALELASQREALLQEVAQQRKSAMLGVDMLNAKLELTARQVREDAHRVVTDLATRETEAWRKVNAKERKLFELQRDVNEQLAALVQREKEVEMREQEAAARCNERRRQVEEWAADLQQQFIKRESELRLMTRNVESDLGILFAARRREVQECPPSRHVHNFASITFRGTELPRVVIDEAVKLDFEVSPHGPLVGMPVTMTYLEGRGGSISGSFVSQVQPDGSIHFSDLFFHGPPGSSHVVLISISRVAAGSVEGLELPIHLKASPSVRAVGSWNVEQLSLTGSLRVVGVEAFGLVGQSMPIVLTHIPSGVTVEETTTANEMNEFPFTFFVPTVSHLTWDEIANGRVFIEAHVPASKFTNPFYHKFQVTCQSPAFPSFQFPPIDRRRDCGLRLQSVDLAYGDLLTDTVLSDSGTLCATADVAGVVCVYRLIDSKWVVKHRIHHESFVGVLQWSTGGTHLATLEPKRHRLHVWSLTDLLLRGDEIPATAEPTAKFNVPLGTTQICPVAEAPPACLVTTTAGTRFYRGKDFLDVADRRDVELSLLKQFNVKRGGQVAFLGYADGTVLAINLSNRKLLCTARIATKDAIMSVCPVGDTRFVVGSKRALLIIGTTPAWTSVQCPFRSPSPLRGIGLLSHSKELTRVILLHDDGHIALVAVEDSRVLGFTTMTDVNGVSAIQGVAILATDVTSPRSDASSPPREVPPSAMTVVGCAALRPFAFKLAITAAGARAIEDAENNVEDDADHVDGTATPGKLPVTYEARFKRRGMGGNQQQGSLQSTPRSAGLRTPRSATRAGAPAAGGASSARSKQ